MEPFTKALLDRTKGLVGAVLQSVHYDVALSELTTSSREDHARTHTNLAAVDLRFESEVLRVLSSDEFTDGTFELGLQGGHARDGSGDATSMNEEVPWSELIGQTVASSKIRWVDSPYVALTKRRKAFSSHHYDAGGAVPFSGPQAPLALELHFANGGRVLLVSGSWTGVHTPIVETGSGISVLWDSHTFATLVPRIAKDLKKSW
jgi:hypothetical protein